MSSCNPPYECQKLPAQRVPGSPELQDGRDVIMTQLIEQPRPFPSGSPERLHESRGLLLKSRRIQLGHREQAGHLRARQRLERGGLAEARTIGPEIGLLERAMFECQQVVHARQHDGPRKSGHGVATMMPRDTTGDMRSACGLPHQKKPTRIAAETGHMAG